MKKNIDNLEIGSSVDLKFGLCTRTIERTGKDRYVINDTSNGWTQATITRKTLDKVLSGEKSLLTLNWK